MSKTFSLDWAYALGRPQASAQFRRTPEDFVVHEDLGFEPCGEGEHVYLHIQKRGENTAWLARQIARLAGVDNNAVGYAGLKDRQAVTRQWFSVYLPKGDEPDWQQLGSDSIQVLAATRHRQKLRRGAHRANHFQIRLHQLEGETGAALQQRLDTVAEQGVPNYFGPQRFGHDGNNLHDAERLLVAGGRIANRQKRGLILSAARSWLFNQVLDRRVGEGSWHSALPGETLVNEWPSGPLWGRGRLAGSEQTVALEQAVLAPLQDWCNGLEHVGLSQERRALVLLPADFRSAVSADSLEVSFGLLPGGYATAVLREICLLKETPAPEDML